MASISAADTRNCTRKPCRRMSRCKPQSRNSSRTMRRSMPSAVASCT
jgi:hypothetical protein